MILHCTDKHSSSLFVTYVQKHLSEFRCQEIDAQNKKAIVIFVPVPQLRAYQKIQTRLVRELEKKFSGKHVVFIAQVQLKLHNMSNRLLLKCI